MLEPAVKLAEHGYPVSTITSYHWCSDEAKLQSVTYGDQLLLNGKAPQPGQLMKNPTLATVLKEIQAGGSSEFYNGWIAEQIVETCSELGGELSLEDLASHKTEISDPIQTTYKDEYTLYEVGPNSQGIIALMALNIIEQKNLENMEHNSAEYLHVLIEALRIAFHDARQYVADHQGDNNYHQLVQALLFKEYAKKRSALIMENHNLDITHG